MEGEGGMKEGYGEGGRGGIDLFSCVSLHISNFIERLESPKKSILENLSFFYQSKLIKNSGGYAVREIPSHSV